MIMALALAAAAPEPAAIALFRSACMDGSAKLRKDQAVPVAWKDVPTAARQLLPQSRFEADGIDNPTDEHPQRLSNTIYRVATEPETYLLLPAPSGSAPYDRTCAVIVRSTLLDQAGSLFGKSKNLAVLRRERQAGGAVVSPRFMSPDESSVGFWDAGYMSDYTDGYLIVAAQSTSWTLFSAAPDVPPCRLAVPESERKDFDSSAWRVTQARMCRKIYQQNKKSAK